MLYGAAVAHEVINPPQSAAMVADTFILDFKNKQFEDVDKKILKTSKSYWNHLKKLPLMP